MSIYDYQLKSINGQEVNMAQFKGKVLLIVNVASQCGFTSQYEGLENLYKKYKDRSLMILGFPCNQFGDQEPGTDEEIKSFCETKFNVTFPLFSKVDVNGDHTHPLYAYLKSEEKGFLGTEGIKWNFTKFLVDRTGRVLHRYAPQTKPEDLEKELEKLL